MDTQDYYECNPNELILSSEDDVLRLFEKMMSMKKLLIYQENLTPDFFDLSTGVAGSILQKFANYSIPTAFVVDLPSVRSEKFKEMAHEANMGNIFRFFEHKQNAVEWLEST